MRAGPSKGRAGGGDEEPRAGGLLWALMAGERDCYQLTAGSPDSLRSEATDLLRLRLQAITANDARLETNYC